MLHGCAPDVPSRVRVPVHVDASPTPYAAEVNRRGGKSAAAALDAHCLASAMRRARAPRVVLAAVCRRWAAALPAFNRPSRASDGARWAAARDSPACLRWLCDRARLPCTAPLSDRLASLGAARCLGWARERGAGMPSVHAWGRAAAAGRLDVLRLAVERGMLVAPRLGVWVHAFACVPAARAGRVSVLRWAHRHGCTVHGASTCGLAAARGRVRVLRWAAALPVGLLDGPDACAGAALAGGLRALRWLRRRGCDWDARVCAYAAWRGDGRVLRWALRRGCPRDPLACAMAAWAGRLRALRLLRAAGCPWDGGTLWAALAGRHDRVAAWARRNGCPATAVHQDVVHHASEARWLCAHAPPRS